MFKNKYSDKIEGFYGAGDCQILLEKGGVMIPWDLIKQSDLNIKELVVYCMCLTTIRQSITNNWLTKRGNYYCYLTNERLCEQTGYSHTTITKILQGLQKKGYISREKNRFGCPDRILVRKGFWDINAIDDEQAILQSATFQQREKAQQARRK